MRGRWSAAALVAPALLATAAAVLWPLVFAGGLSLRDARLDLSGPFVGLANYGSLVADPGFRGAFATTLAFTALSTVLSMALGLALALALERAFAGRDLLRTAALLPWVCPAVAAAAIFRYLLNEQVGPLAALVERLGLAQGPPIGDPRVLFATAVLVDVWRTAPLMMLLIAAGLRGVPRSLVEAARVEGAGPLAVLLRVKLPLLRSAILVALLIRLLDAFRVYDLFWVLADRQLDSLSTLVYRDAVLSQLDFSLGNAAAIVVFLGALVLAALFVGGLRLGERSDLAESEELEGGRAAGSGQGVGARFAGPAAGLALALLSLLPFAWIFRVSVERPAGLLRDPASLLPRSFSASAYGIAAGNPDFLHELFNSAVIASLTAFLTLALAAPAAYALARLRPRYGAAPLAAVVAVAFLPPVAVVAPLFGQLRLVRLVNTYWALVLPDTAFALPLAILLLTAFFRGLPRGVEEAARVDGAGTARLLGAVIVPLAGPGLFATGALMFVTAWNEFVFANSFSFDPGTQPATVGLADLVARAGAGGDFGPVAAAVLLVALPSAALVVVAQRRLVSGLLGGAARG